MISGSGNERLSNSEVRELLARRVTTELLGKEGGVEFVESSPITSNYYSFTFSLKVRTLDGVSEVFVKIPKKDLRAHVRDILPIEEGDRQMGEDEAQSLQFLNQRWQGDAVNVYWVNLRGVITEFNALVTDGIDGEEATTVFRRLDLRRRCGFLRDAGTLRSSMARLGEALGRYHQNNAVPAVFRLSDALPKVESYCRALRQSSGSVLPELAYRTLENMAGLELPGLMVPTIKGIDVRNVVVDADNSLYLLDPGKSKLTFRETDIARFVMTYRILYWGSPLLMFVREPDRNAELSFLEAYNATTRLSSSRLLDIYILKEQLKHWHTAMQSLEKVNWAPVVQRIVERIYVRPFYEAQVASQLSVLTH